MISSHQRLWADIQSILLEGLTAFLNGDAQSRLGRVLYPWSDSQIRNYWTVWFQRLSSASSRLDDQTPIPKAAVLSNTDQIAAILSGAYTWMLERHPNEDRQNRPPQETTCLKLFEEATYLGGDPFLIPVGKLWQYACEHLTENVAGLYLHGSLSTLDYVPGSSDLDALLVINNSTLSSPGRLLAARHHAIQSLRWFYRIDFSQHHGYFVLTEFDLDHFDDALFPSILFAISTNLLGPNVVRLRRRSILEDRTLPFRKMVTRIESVSKGSESLNGWFELKLFLQGVLLLPSLYLQAVGSPTYKRDSFAPVQTLVSSDAWQIIEKVTQLRALGIQKSLILPWADEQLTRLPSPWTASMIHRWFRNGIPATVFDVLGDNWVRQSVALADSLSNRLQNPRFAQ